MEELMIVNSNIKGYHIFKIIPHPQIEMITEKQIGNPRDPHTMVLKLPGLNEIPENFYEDIIKEKRGKEKQQTVKYTTGAIIGRVPANICKLFEKLITDVAVSDPEQNKIPPLRQSFKKKLNEYGRRGGGAAVPCKFKLACHDSSYLKVKDYLQKELSQLNFQGKETFLENTGKVLPLSTLNI